MSQLLSNIFQGLFYSGNSKPKNRNIDPGYKFFNLYLTRVRRVNFVSENALLCMNLMRRQIPEMTDDRGKSTDALSEPTHRIHDLTEPRDEPIMWFRHDQLSDRENFNSNSPNPPACTRNRQELEQLSTSDIEPEVYKYQQKLNRFDFLKQQLLRHPNETYLSTFLGKLRIKHTISVYKEKQYRLESPEIFCKNLLLKDRKGKFYYLICVEDKATNFKLACKSLSAYRNLSFASEAETASILHVQKGGITPFALMHETASHVTVAITTDLVEEKERLMNFHPFESNLTLSLTLESLQIYLKVFDHSLKFVTV